MNLLFPGVDGVFFEKASHAIGWQMEGSGLNFTRADMLAMSIHDLTRAAKFAHDQRARQAAAMRAATKSKR